MTSSTSIETTWSLAVYSEDYNFMPELTEVGPESPAYQQERAKSKREAWETLKRSYPGKGVPIHYLDGSHAYVLVPRRAA